MPDLSYIAWVPLLPLISFLIIGLAGRRYFPKWCGITGTVSVFAAFILAAGLTIGYFFDFGMDSGVYRQILPLKYTWLQFSEGISIDMGLLIDPISVLLILIVTFISLMVHIYSLGYMKGDPRIATYYAFLGLFTFSMLGLVLSSNLFQIYIFWELVGVSSFLLIGYYYDKPSAVAAAKKAFIVTRFADLGFLIGILILANQTGTLDFQTLIASAGKPENSTALHGSMFLGCSALTWGLLLVFMGGAGKSAMFPLHIWLPDAMEGPTPVSALIHAATMVVAGVYLVARLFPVYAFSGQEALDVVAWIGVFTSFFAAVIACTQTDIKRVLAYSTISQIGFMMFALGVSGYGGEAGLGYTASMFHLYTHAIFKALLFLGAGAVIHYVHSNEIGDMGGLRKKIPVTHMTFLVACLAIAGIPPFAGFFSKEEILLAVWNENKVIFYLALVTAGMTAFYMFRLYFSVFWNKEYSKEHAAGHDAVEIHGKRRSEGPGTMLVPLIILAVLSVFAGFVPFGSMVSSDGLPLPSEFHPLFSVAPVALSLIGILLAAYLYRSAGDRPARVARSVGALYKMAYRKFYIDELYLFLTRNIIYRFIGSAAAWTDRNIVDGVMNGLGRVTGSVSDSIRFIQSGKLQDYALYFYTGVIGFVLLLIYLWT